MSETPEQSDSQFGQLDSQSKQSDPQVPIVCSACGTETSVPLAELAETIDCHNRQQHDGEEIAEVDPALADQLADLVAEELELL